jgi:oligo-1,6-glucosidase
MRFWLDKGVDGFRMDVINMISKPWQADGSLPDAPVVRDGFLQPGFGLTCNGPRLLEFLREMREQVLDHYDTITVGEAPMATIQQGVELTNEQSGALNMLFQFEHMDLDSVGGHINGKWALKNLDLRDLKKTMTRWQDALAGQGWNSLYLSNHDQPRPVSRFGDDGRYRVESAKMLATWLHLHQGTPYVYQGEELGMSNVAFDRIEDYQDIESRNMYRVATEERGLEPAAVLHAIHAKGRDNARTPLQWDERANAGFTSGTPWLKLNPNYPQINAAQALADPDSVFHYYRQLIALRKAHPIAVQGRFELLLPEHPQIYAYTRTLGDECWLVICNFSADQPVFELPAALVAGLQRQPAELIISNYNDASGNDDLHALVLRPYEARVIRLRA